MKAREAEHTKEKSRGSGRQDGRAEASDPRKPEEIERSEERVGHPWQETTNHAESCTLCLYCQENSAIHFLDIHNIFDIGVYLLVINQLLLS